MNQHTFNAVPAEAKAALARANASIVLDETVPSGKVRVDPEGTEMRLDDWLHAIRFADREDVAARRDAHKLERNRKRDGRWQRRR